MFSYVQVRTPSQASHRPDEGWRTRFPSVTPAWLLIAFLFHSGSGSAISLHISALFPFLEFAECPWLLWSDPWGPPFRPSPAVSPPPTTWRSMPSIFSPLTPCLVQDSAHSALGWPPHLRGCPGRSSGSISTWILANSVSIPVTWAYFLGGFEALHRICILSTIEKKLGRKVEKNPTHLGVRDFWSHHLSSPVGVAKVL